MDSIYIDVKWKYKTEEKEHIKRGLLPYEANALIYNIVEHNRTLVKRYGHRKNLEYIKME